jgi:phosphate starvation-inducible PhoH-like protein
MMSPHFRRETLHGGLRDEPLSLSPGRAIPQRFEHGSPCTFQPPRKKVSGIRERRMAATVPEDTTATELAFDQHHRAREIFGPREERLRAIEQRLSVQVVARGGTVKITGDPQHVQRARAVLGYLLDEARKGYPIDQYHFLAALEKFSGGKNAEGPAGFPDRIEVPSRKRYVFPRTPGQREYVESMKKSDIVFAIGPAGTGKTYLAMAMAVSELVNDKVSRLILARPAVEAGEKLGFLPGDMAEKVSPYLRPLYDALYDMMEIPRIQKLTADGIIEVAPLAFMRGRTLNDAFIILDEAQNTTSEQMKMFLTRLGFNSKAVVTGDITQIDLPQKRASGLMEVRGLLEGIEGIKFCYLTEQDVVRHEIVQKIVRAYEERDKERAAGAGAEGPPVRVTGGSA